MITYHSHNLCRFFSRISILILFVFSLILHPACAGEATDPQTAAVEAMQVWLKGIDQNQYTQSWKDASASFQKAVTSAQWSAALNAARTPLGKCNERKLASALHQTEVPSPTGIKKGDFVVAQFDSSFANLKYAVETVCFEKATDGTWKASGYYIKPKP